MLVKKRFPLFALFLLFLFPEVLIAGGEIAQSAHKNERSAQVNVVLQKALHDSQQLKLAQHQGWLALLHYKTETLSRRIISQADDPAFFLADNGKTDAEAELKADLQAFFQPGPKSKKHAQCLFPARWFWLKQQLGLGDDYDFACYHLQVFMEAYETDYLTLVFPAMYLNNPGSTFGHTFLRFDGRHESVLFSETLNYAAKINKSDSLPAYIVKGLFGGYPGIFKTRKYYETVQEYSNLENRDIWEYRLALTPEEIKQLVRHVWEVKGIDFDYYFFRENCAFRLLALLDAVRPGLNLTTGNQFPLYAIPVDTVRALDAADMIAHRHFRPSLATQLKQFYLLAEQYRKQQTARPVDLARQVTMLADEAIQLPALMQSELQTDEKAVVLDQAYNLLQFRGQADKAVASDILSARSRINIHGEHEPVMAALLSDSEIKLDDGNSQINLPPESGHQSRRFAAGVGHQLGETYIDLRLRPAFHDLIDATAGYVSGADINVLDTRIKYFTDSQRLRLESLRFFNITSLSPVSQWYKPVSWLLDIRLDRTSLLSASGATGSREINSVQSFLLRGGAGYSFHWQGFSPFAMAVTEWNLAKQYDKGYSLYVGAQVGSLLTTKIGQGVFLIERDTAVSGFELDKTRYEIQWQFNLDVNTALRLAYRKKHYSQFDDNDWSLNLNLYF